MAARPSLLPCSLTSYMRTFLSHDDTARKSPVGENARSETLSEGGSLSGMSFERSPAVLDEAVAALVLLLKSAISGSWQ